METLEQRRAREAIEAQIEMNRNLRPFRERTEAERLVLARKKMETGWNKLGASRAVVGLPWNRAMSFTVKPTGRDALGEPAGYKASFRGGHIFLNEDGAKCSVNKFRTVNITLVGIECQIRQEGTDEIYGVVGVFGPSNAEIKTVRFPENGFIEMGDDGARLQPLNIDLVRDGIIQDYAITVAMVEHDSGDADAVAQDVMAKFREYGAKAITGLTGFDAESAMDSNQDLVAAATAIIGIVARDLLGVEDDAYPPNVLRLDWAGNKDGFALQPPVRRADDARVVENWTHELMLEGVDFAGDRGRYRLLFHVWSEIIVREIHCDV